MPRTGPTRVLVLAPTAADAELTGSILTSAGFEHLLCRRAGEVAREIRDGAGALLLTEEALRTDTVELIEALREQPGWSDVPTLLLAAPGASSRLAATAKELLGNVTVLDRPVRLRTLVSTLDAAIRARRRQYELRTRLRELERAQEEVERLNAELRTELSRMNRLHAVSTRLVQTTHLPKLLEETLAAAIELTHADGMGNLQVVESGVLRIAAHRGLSARFLEFFATVHEGMAACGRVFERKERVVIEDVQSSPLFAGQPAREVLLREGIRALQSTPMVSRSGEVVGLVSTHYRQPRVHAEADLRILDLLARQASDFIERTHGEEALKEADRRKDSFLATLAHELRNPLAPIRNALEILRLVEDDPAEIERFRRIIERQLEHMVRLIDDLLDVNRITRGKLELRKELVSLQAVLQAAVDTARPQIEAARHRLCTEIPDEAIVLEADTIRLTQVFANVLNNAAKYMEPEGTIWLTVDRQGGEVSVTVRDEGMGIADEALNEVFEMFTQMDGSSHRAGGGLGIGLTLARQLAEMHGGTVEAHSEGPGKGAAFTVRLPVSSAPGARSDTAAARPGMTPAAEGLRIVVADDNEDAAESMRALLQMMGHEVETAADGFEAVAGAERLRPDIVFLDIGMPELDGYSAARRIREQPWGKAMIMVAVTGWGHADDKQRAREAGFDHHFTKPLQPADLQDLMRSLQPDRKASR